jgi:predicted P-loop ATPase
LYECSLLKKQHSPQQEERQSQCSQKRSVMQWIASRKSKNIYWVVYGRKIELQKNRIIQRLWRKGKTNKEGAME